MSELVFFSASQLAKLIRERSVSSVEVIKAYLIQIEKHNSKLNAIATLNEEIALQRAKQADEALARGENWGPLHGVPVTIKDVFETAGLCTTAGHKPLRKYIPDRDATAVARLYAAGAIGLGKTNTSVLAGDYQSDNPLFGRVNNPWNSNYSAGGSSGGSAAAIAAGLSPLDLASDIGGSIRQPSHFCGVFGLKPTDRRVPTIGHIPEVPPQPKCIRQMLTVGPLARSIEDLSLCLKIIAGADLRQPEIPPVPLDIPSSRPIERLRIALCNELVSFPVARSIKLAIDSVARKLADVGTPVERWVPKFDFLRAWQVYYVLGIYNLLYARSLDLEYVRESFSFLFREATRGDRALRKLSNVPGIALPIFFNPTLKDYFQALTERDRLTTEMDEELENWDAWLCPVAMTPAFTHCPKGEAVEIDGRKVPYQMASGAYLIPFNLTGHPTVVIPIGETQEGLPIGMQIVGKRWREMELLAIASQIVEVLGWFRSPPEFID